MTVSAGVPGPRPGIPQRLSQVRPDGPHEERFGLVEEVVKEGGWRLRSGHMQGKPLPPVESGGGNRVGEGVFQGRAFWQDPILKESSLEKERPSGMKMRSWKDLSSTFGLGPRGGVC
jgi:hypothetical protein